MEKLLEQVDGLLLTSWQNRFYGSGGDISEGVALITKTGCRYYTDSRYLEAAQKEIPNAQVLLVDRQNSYTKRLREDLEQLQVKTLGYEEDQLTVSEFEAYRKALPVEFVPMQNQLDSLRWIKQDWKGC